MKILEQWRSLIGRKRHVYISDEIMEQILSKIPAKSLLRFKDVGKRWHSLISNPYFVQTHLKHVLSVPEDHQQIMILSHYFRLIRYDGDRVDYTCNLPPSIHDNCRYLLGSCNGLLCLDGNKSLILWNPLFNDYKQVSFVLSPLEDWFGFGYDSHSEDYKFVKANLNKKEAEVYSLKSASNRIMPFQLGLDPYYNRVPDVGKAFNGSLYWLFTSSNLKYFLVEFDLRYEKFRFHELPTYMPRIDGVILGILRDSVAICFGEPGNNTYFNLVKMKEDGLKDGKISWSRAIIQHPQGMTVEHLQGIARRPIGLTMNGEFIMRLLHYADDAIIYNEQKGTIKNIMAEEWQECLTYIETLVLPSMLFDVVDEKVRPKSMISRVLNKFVRCIFLKSY